MRVRLAAAALLLAPAALPAAAQGSPVVTVPGGKVRGAEQDGTLVFRGIPYAAPPLSELRWKPPQPAPAWDAIRDAADRAPACPQVSEGWNETEAARWSEDCLTLDIRTPSLSGALPVMVWIHGGSNRAGSSAGPADSDMSAQGVVHVGIQYRLGLLGFLSHPELSAEGGGASGNYALMDQVAALQWVRENIAFFGGDPANVTIYGESAGSQNVSLLLAAPSARGLFHKAILQSGTPGFGLAFRPLADAEAMGERLGPVADLRIQPVEDLLALQAEFGEPATRGAGMIFLRTTVDGNVLPDTPDRLIAANAPKPVIIGTDKVEFGNDVQGKALEEEARFWFGSRAGEALAVYRAEEADPRRGSIGMRIGSDAVFHCPADRVADLLAENGWPVWRYEFDVGENGGLTRHAYEIGFIFERKPVGGGVQMQDYWAALAIGGDPNADTALGVDRPHWKRWEPGTSRQMAFGEAVTEMEPGKPRAPFCAFTENY